MPKAKKRDARLELPSRPKRPLALKGALDWEFEEEELGRVFDHQVAGRLVPYLSPYKLQIAIGLIGTLLTSFGAVAGPWIIAEALNVLVSGGGIAQLDLLVIAYIGIGVGSWLAQWVQAWAMTRVGEGVMLALRMALFNHIHSLSLGFFDANETGRIMSRVQNDTGQMEELLETGIVSAMAEVVTLVGVVIAVFLMDMQLALITTSVIPVLIVFLIVWQKHSRSAFLRVRLAISAVNGTLQENITGVRVVQALQRERVNYDRFKKLNRENYDANMEAVRMSSILPPFVEILVAVALALVLIFGGRQVIDGSLDVGTVVGFALYVQRFFDPIRNLTQQYTQFQKAMSAGARIFEVLDIVPEIQERPGAKDIKAPKGRVTFEHVHLRYLPDIEVLHDVNLDVRPGEKVAVIGPTGAGKSSLVNLIPRLYEATNGAVKVDGQDVRGLRRASLLRHVALVLQDPFLFSGTVRENITYGRLEATDEEMIAAAKAVGVHGFIAGLEKGYDTVLTERGGNLSHGQRQLISFARTLLADPTILVLDEATASVDTETEEIIQRALRTLLEGRTAFIIAHRLSTTRDADRVIVVNDGRIVEEGAHAELLAKNGLFARLHRVAYGPEEAPKRA
jgi:ATP-binding cassette subfamily B protein